jgi:hypothetical protein
MIRIAAEALLIGSLADARTSSGLASLPLSNAGWPRSDHKEDAMNRMKAKLSMLVTVMGCVGALALTASPADAQTCQPGIGTALAGPQMARYQTLINALVPSLGSLGAQLVAVVDQATYQTLLTTANAVAATPSLGTTGRVLITVPDGTVLLDTARDDDTGDPTSNSYQHFLDKTINENHNSRVAVFVAQEYPCGVGVESKLSTTTGQREVYFSYRVGTHLDSYGTIRISNRQ